MREKVIRFFTSDKIFKKATKCPSQKETFALNLNSLHKRCQLSEEGHGIVFSEGFEHSNCISILAITSQCHSGGHTLSCPLLLLFLVSLIGYSPLPFPLNSGDS